PYGKRRCLSCWTHRVLNTFLRQSPPAGSQDRGPPVRVSENRSILKGRIRDVDHGTRPRQGVWPAFSPATDYTFFPSSSPRVYPFSQFSTTARATDPVLPL